MDKKSDLANAALFRKESQQVPARKWEGNTLSTDPHLPQGIPLEQRSAQLLAALLNRQFHGLAYLINIITNVFLPRSLEWDLHSHNVFSRCQKWLIALSGRFFFFSEKVGVYLGANNRHKHSHFVSLLVNFVCSPFDLFCGNLRDHVVSPL